MTAIKQIIEAQKKKERRLTLKQERFAEAYIANSGNAVKAMEQTYPGHKTYNSRGVSGHYNLKNPKITKKIDELKQTAFEQLPALSESVILKLKDALNAYTSQKDLVSIGRLILELAGFLGTKNSSSVNITINQGSMQTNIDSLGIVDAYALRDALNKHLVKLGAVETSTSLDTEWAAISSTKPDEKTNDSSLSPKVNNEQVVSDEVQVKETRGDFSSIDNNTSAPPETSSPEVSQ